MIQPIAHDRFPVGSENALGVELQAAQVEAAVAQGHHLALLAQRDGLEAGGQRGGVDHPGVVAPDGKFRRQAGE